MENLFLSKGKWTLELTEHGHVVSLRHDSVELGPSLKSPAVCEVFFGEPERKIVVTSSLLRKHTASSAQFETAVDVGKRVTILFEFNISEPDDQGTAVTCKVALSSDAPLQTDVRLRWFWNVRLQAEEATLFAPLFDGRGLRTSRSKRSSWHYVCSGGWGGGESDRLAIPMIDESSPESRLHMTYFADPFFSTGINLPANGSHETFECQFLCGLGSHQFVERMFGIYIHTGDADSALEGFFRHGITNCPPGPRWIHDIAMVHYDYLSEKGEGWFRDIDKLTALISVHDRGRVALTLHGWYDLLGRYCYNEESKKFDDHWMVMPKGDRREMTLDEIHRRLGYAKERGFRVLLYYADGLAIDSGAPNYDQEIVFLERDGSLRKHHWAGPDTIGQTYIMNPLHPRVEAFFQDYTRALLAEFGGELDGLTWDETFTIRVGDLSGGRYPGYADRSFMLLAKALRDIVKAANRDLAFLASDCTGLRLPQDDGSYWSAKPAQNALVFDGTYQDSQCNPTAWQYGIFPNYRNALWSCNWKPVENFEWTVLGVKAFGAPVAISNGFSENIGISRYAEKDLEKLMQLFELRKGQRSEVHWIECREA